MCFELKYRSGTAFGSPEESLTPKKKQSLYYAVLAYCQSKNLSPDDVRFDFIAIEDTNGQENLRHYKNVALV